MYNYVVRQDIESVLFSYEIDSLTWLPKSHKFACDEGEIGYECGEK